MMKMSWTKWMSLSFRWLTRTEVRISADCFWWKRKSMRKKARSSRMRITNKIIVIIIIMVGGDHFDRFSLTGVWGRVLEEVVVD